MRKTASIILLVVLIFNMVGYRAWFYYAEKRSDAAIESRLDKSQYNESDLISITVPLDNPYLLEQTSFVRVDGEISFQGKSFKYVKRKITDGKLVLLCIPDAEKTQLKKAKVDFGNNLNDLPGSNKNSSKSGFQKNLNYGGDYISHSAGELKYRKPGKDLILFTHSIPQLSDAFVSSPGKPPKSLNLV